ncbi:uncharacterized protein YALI1_E29065g [Yarrowia lipolytica]|uniref:Uncharacterized protein n=1 Tax=Yarrowia lipolytica TaxID=4952 RepID=A0A1D8NJU6_YARLL|nr:hypothetical protein YALI1_E29065g [Yarrowia lipolytica]
MSTAPRISTLLGQISEQYLWSDHHHISWWTSSFWDQFSDVICLFRLRIFVSESREDVGIMGCKAGGVCGLLFYITGTYTHCAVLAPSILIISSCVGTSGWTLMLC